MARIILATIHQHGLISASEAASILAVKERRARAVLQALVKQGLQAISCWRAHFGPRQKDRMQTPTRFLAKFR